MSRKIIGITVGTSINPQKVIEKTEQAKQIEQNTIDISNKADIDHNHDDLYETKTDAQTKLDETKAYIDDQVNTLSAWHEDFVECSAEDITNLFK